VKRLTQSNKGDGYSNARNLTKKRLAGRVALADEKEREGTPAGLVRIRQYRIEKTRLKEKRREKKKSWNEYLTGAAKAVGARFRFMENTIFPQVRMSWGGEVGEVALGKGRQSMQIVGEDNPK